VRQRSREIQAVHCALCRSYDQGQGWNRTGCRKEQYDAIRRVKASYSVFGFLQGENQKRGCKGVWRRLKGGTKAAKDVLPGG
jgi:hypothetical protein